MQKWIVPTYRVQIINEENGVICLVIMFTQKDLSVALKCFAQAVTNFLPSSVENTKKSHILHFNNHNSGSKHDFYQFLNILTPFFSSTLWVLSVDLSISSLHSKNFKIPFRGSPICFMFWSVKYTFTCRWSHFEAC